MKQMCVYNNERETTNRTSVPCYDDGNRRQQIIIISRLDNNSLLSIHIGIAKREESEGWN